MLALRVSLQLLPRDIPLLLGPLRSPVVDHELFSLILIDEICNIKVEFVSHNIVPLLHLAQYPATQCGVTLLPLLQLITYVLELSKGRRLLLHLSNHR